MISLLTLLKNIKNIYKVTATDLLFPASTVNDTNQMFVTLCELNKAKMALINGKILNILRITLGAETFAGRNFRDFCPFSRKFFQQ